MIAHNLEQMYTQGLNQLEQRETRSLGNESLADLPLLARVSFVLPLAVRQFQRLDQEDPTLAAPEFGILSLRERNGCALLLLALSEGEIGASSVATAQKDQISLLRMDRLSAEEAQGDLGYSAAAKGALPIWLRAAYTVFQFALECGDGWDEFLELPDQLDLDDPNFDLWLQTTRSPAFWHILIEHHAEMLSPQSLKWILSQPSCDLGTAISFAFRFAHMRQTVGASYDAVQTIFDGMQDLPKCRADERTDIVFSLFQRAEILRFGPEKYASAYGLNVEEQFECLETLGQQVETAGRQDLPLPIAFLTRSMADKSIASPYVLSGQNPEPPLQSRPIVDAQNWARSTI